ncbi:MAG: reverse transcriptase family protein [Bacteroidetes bacterium]|nr:reverse transcriptase family protein [Bacteroidota bacterium]
MANHPSRLELRALKDAFLAIRTPADLCSLLAEDMLELSALALKEDNYEAFFVQKRNGEQRLIENPSPPLKRIQRKLNDCLQAVYHFHRSSAAYGFLSACSDDPPWAHRGIVANARQHLGRPWMLNMDVEDFFHAILADRVAWVFLNKPFSFDTELTNLLMRLCIYKGRLPMGAPTSPILSNFAARLLDTDLELLARSKQWLYTRYADDMTISSRQEITEDDVQLLRDYYRAHSFEANEKKTKLMGPKDVHTVTGIVLLENRLDLLPEFFEDLDSEIGKLSEIAGVKGRLGITLMDWVDDYAEKIQGMISFAAHVLGESDARVVKAEKALGKAQHGPKDYGAVSWLDFPYH